MPEPLLSLVVPTYNRAHLLPATLNSLQAQENRDYEIIIVDDGSTDNTEEVIRPFLNPYTRYVRKANAERAAARNYGARLAAGQYVNFFDSDDLALPNHTSEAVRMIKQYRQPEWFHLAYEWLDQNGRSFKKVNNRKGHTLNRSLVTGNHLGCNGVFIRRGIFLTQLFNEDLALSASEDYELWLRLAVRYPLYYSNTITSQLVNHNERSVNIIDGKRLINRLELLLINVSNDSQIVKYFGRDMAKIKADCYSYIALHLSERIRWKIQSYTYLIKALRSSIRFVKSRRFLAITRNLIFRWGN